jgi:hypothetical protein
MASSIAQRGVRENWSVDSILATTLVTLAASTSLLGVALIIIGKLRYDTFITSL